MEFVYITVMIVDNLALKKLCQHKNNFDNQLLAAKAVNGKLHDFILSLYLILIENGGW